MNFNSTGNGKVTTIGPFLIHDTLKGTLVAL